jgi:uncharacterized phage protein (TIGR01671 family)
MNREFKFRGWEKDYSFMFATTTLEEMLSDPICSENIELMQYTGLKDKNGKEIYEGDIVNIKEYPLSSPFTIIYEDGSYYFAEILENNEYDREDVLGYYKPEEIEVIGNIYENSELLGTTND